MLTGIVLSGGRGRRFGCEKGLVRLVSEPMAGIVVKTLLSVTDEVIVSVARDMGGKYRSTLGEEVTVVEDRKIGVGPLEGLTTALEVARGDYVIVSPCDTPLIRAEVCRMLFERGRGRDGAVPRIRGYLEPLHASYKRDSCLRAFEEAKARGCRRPKDAYDLLDLVTVEEDEIRALDAQLDHFTNINTREDYERVVASLSERPGPTRPSTFAL